MTAKRSNSYRVATLQLNIFYFIMTTHEYLLFHFDELDLIFTSNDLETAKRDVFN